MPSSSAQRSSASSPRPSAVSRGPQPARHRDRHAVGAEDLLDEPGDVGRGAPDDRDLLRRPSRRGSARRPRAATSSTSARSPPPSSSSRASPAGTVAASKSDRAPGAPSGPPPRTACARGGAAPAPRSARPRRVSSVTSVPGSAAQVLEGPGAGGQRGAARLVGQRQRHVGARVAGQRLDRVALQRREVVEAVDDDRRLAPRGRGQPQRVERRGVVERVVGRLHPLELAPVRRGRARRARRRRAGGRARPPSTPAAPRSRAAGRGAAPRARRSGSAARRRTPACPPRRPARRAPRGPRRPRRRARAPACPAGVRPRRRAARSRSAATGSGRPRRRRPTPEAASSRR